MRSDRRNGFSLVNVLVTILIGLTLIGMGTLSVSKARQYAHLIQCQNNLQQIYQYWMMYLQDHKDSVQPFANLDDLSPQQPYFKEVLESYVGHSLEDIFICPADPRPDALKKRQGSYDIQDALAQSGQGFAFGQINNKGNTIVMGDYRSGWHDSVFEKKQKRINVLFADGSVEWVSEEDWQKGLKSRFFNNESVSS